MDLSRHTIKRNEAENSCQKIRDTEKIAYYIQLSGILFHSFR